MRGKEEINTALCEHRGITPAYAGKSSRSRAPLHGSRDHPRVCGEKLDYGAGMAHRRGSPPRMRGKVVIKVGAVARLGITPAYAGKRKFMTSHSN